MNDLLAIGIVAILFAALLVLVRLCDALRPR
jgi:hypothetical protein